MKNWILSLCLALLGTSLSAKKASVDHSLFDALLKDHVKSGLVDYQAVSDDPRLETYLEILKRTQVKDLSSDEQLAFYINAYNAFTLQLIAEAYPVQSIRLISGLGETVKSVDDGRPWKIPFVKLKEATYTLDQLEHEVLRARFQDPRIHFAIVCAAVSCPQLRAEAYTAEKLNEQLNEQGRIFLEEKNRFSLEEKKAELSKILEWFAGDFGQNQVEVLQALSPYLPEPLANSLHSDPQSWSVSYSHYDWSLNQQ